MSIYITTRSFVNYRISVLMLHFSPVLMLYFSWDLPVKHISNDLYSAPLTIFNETKYTMVLSSFKEFMVSSMFYDGKSDAVQQGIIGMITEIPKGFIQQSVMQFGAGIKEVSYS